MAQRNAQLGLGLTSLINGLSGDGESLTAAAGLICEPKCVYADGQIVGKVFEH